MDDPLPCVLIRVPQRANLIGLGNDFKAGVAISQPMNGLFWGQVTLSLAQSADGAVTWTPEFRQSWVGRGGAMLRALQWDMSVGSPRVLCVLGAGFSGG